MKRNIIVRFTSACLVLLLSHLIFVPQLSAQVKDTVFFQPKGSPVIRLSTLSNGNHNFTAAGGARLVLTIKNKTIIGQAYYLPSGEKLVARNGIEELSCPVCTTIEKISGQMERSCRSVPCSKAQKLNTSMNSGPVNH